jgi:glycosyltransferase involved in cell wall biosynthesis
MRYENYYPIALKNKFNILTVDDDDINNYLRVINKVNPDIIHIHGSESMFTCILKYTNVPTILSIQGIMAVISRRTYLSIEKKYWGKSNFVKDFLNFITFNRLQLNKEDHQKAAMREFKNLQYCKHIIGRTDWDRYVSKVIAPNATYYHNDEIMRPIFFNHVWKFPEQSNVVNLFSISSGAPYKGFELICETLHILNEMNVQVQWMVAGIAENAPIVKAVKKKLKNRYPKHNLCLLGHQKENQIVEQMLNAHLYIMASHIENGCNALSEAMLVGMPCITSLSGGTGTTVTNNQDGLVLQGGDPHGLAGAIIELSNDKERCVFLGKNARDKALKRHNPNAIVDDLLSIYKKVLKTQ